MTFKSKDFKALQKHWYSRLEKEGFQDIEQKDGLLKEWHSYMFMRSDNNSKYSGPSKQEYYRLAGQFLYEHQFSSKSERYMWEMHSNGISIEDIVDIIDRRKTKDFGKFVNKRNVHETLQRLAKEMLEKCRK